MHYVGGGTAWPASGSPGVDWGLGGGRGRKRNEAGEGRTRQRQRDPGPRHLQSRPWPNFPTERLWTPGGREGTGLATESSEGVGCLENGGHSPGPATGRGGHEARGLGQGWRGVSLHRWSLCLPHPPTKPHAPMTASPPGAGPRRFGRSRPDPPGAPGSPRAMETGKRGTARARGKPESPASGRRTEESAVPGPGPGTGAEVCGCRVPALSADLSSQEPWDERLDLAPQKATPPGTAWTKRTKLEDTRLDFCACAKAARGQDGGDARVRVAERRGPKRTHANTAGDWSSAKA